MCGVVERQGGVQKRKLKKWKITRKSMDVFDCYLREVCETANAVFSISDF